MHISEFGALFFGQLSAPSLASLLIHADDIREPYIPCQNWSLPRLERLEIRAPLKVFWAPFIRASLQHLVLDSCLQSSPSGADGDATHSAKSLPLLEILLEVPFLRSLEIRLDKYTEELEAPAGSRILLSQLQLLQLSGHTAHCTILLNSLSIPITTTIRMNGTKNYRHRDSRQFGRDTSNIAFVMDSMLDDPQGSRGELSRPHARSPLSVALAIHDGSTTFTLRAWTNFDSPRIFDNTDFQPDLDIIVPCRESQTHLESLTAMISLCNVRCLEIGPMDLLGPFGNTCGSTLAAL